MTTTAKHDLTSASWTQVSTGSRDVGIQLLGNGRAYVHVATSAPALGAAGIVVDRDGPASFGGLAGTDNVYARAIDDPAIIIVVKS